MSDTISIPNYNGSKSSNNEIIAVSPNSLASEAKKLRQIGKEFNTQINSTYDKIKNMHSSWQGEGYANICKEFNKLVTDINKVLNYMVTEVPYSLEKIANLFSNADEAGNVTTESKDAYNAVVLLNPPKDEKMKFVSSEVEAVKNNVLADFEKVKGQLNNFLAEFQKIEWNNSIALEFYNTFAGLKNKLFDSFSTIEQKFKTFMNETISAIQAVENANTTFL